MLSALLVAGLVATQAPVMVVETSGESSTPCLVESGAGEATAAACDDKTPRIEVTSGSPVARSAPRAAPAAHVERAPSVRLETLAIYARDGDVPITLSVDTTPDLAYSDMQTLRAVAARLEARASTWRYSGE